MSLLERPELTGQNPAVKFLNWKSDDKCFEYYDKILKAKVKQELPLKLFFVEHYHTVKGWHDATQKGIYSNEVYLSSKEELDVKTFGGLKIAKGIFKDIKPQIESAGANYHRSIYCVNENFELINIALKGSCIGGIKAEKSLNGLAIDGYSEFYNKNGRLLDNQWFEIISFSEGKSGKINYSIPNFIISDHAVNEDFENIKNIANQLQNFVNKRNNSNINVIDAEIVNDVEPLDF